MAGLPKPSFWGTAGPGKPASVLALVTLAFAATCLNAAPASAGLGDLSLCSQLERVVPLQDGSAVAAGSTWSSDNCQSQPDFGGKRILVRFKPGGLLDQSFGDGGVAIGPANLGPVIDLFRTPDDGYLLVSNFEVDKFDESGQLDHGFADGGRLDPDSLGDASADIKSAQVQGGNLYLFQTADGNPAIAGFQPDGTRDPGFGQNGLLRIPVSAWENDHANHFTATAFSIDSHGRFVIAGGASILTGPMPNEGYSTTAVKRLNPSGTLDTSFGPAPGGITHLEKSVCLGGCLYWVDQVRFGDGGTIVMLGTEVHEMVKAPRCHDLEVSTITANGDPGPIPPHIFGDCRAEGVTDLLPGGDVIAPGRSYDEAEPGSRTFSVSRFSLSDLTSGPYGMGPSLWASGIDVTGGLGQQTISAVRDPERDQIVAVGYANVSVCKANCYSTRSMVMARFDQETGAPIADFGLDGAMMLPGNRCPYGSVAGTGETPNWTRCRLRPPDSFVRARLIGRKTKHPRLVVTAAPGSPPSWFWATTQTLRLHLPARLGPVHLSDLKVTLPGKGTNGVKTVGLTGRTVVATFKADQGYCDDYYGCSDPDPTITFEVQAEVGNRREALTAFRRKTLKVSGSMSFIPAAGPSKSWAPNSSRFTARVGSW